MRYLAILLIILLIGGCQNKTAIFGNSLKVVEENKEEIERLRDGVNTVNNGVNKVNNDDEVINSSINNRINFINNSDNPNDQIPNEPVPSDQLPVISDKGHELLNDLVVPKEFDLPIAFVSQAPNAIWDELHKEACEEAAMIMAVKYLRGEDLDKQIMEEEILTLVKWEQENGYKIDVTAKEAGQILQDYFGLQAEVTSEVTVERIKQELVLGNLVITPHAGRELGNPYYRQPGPRYHFLVLRGWTGEEFITNDAGTKRGEGYKYKFDKLINTTHDWNGGEVETGERVMIVVGKP